MSPPAPQRAMAVLVFRTRETENPVLQENYSAGKICRHDTHFLYRGKLNFSEAGYPSMASERLHKLARRFGESHACALPL
jgi:hypothetical protein